MEKADVKSHEAQSDTSSVINMKEYAPSEYPTSEAPPAYMKPRATAYKIARLVAFTVIASAVILGSFIFASAWIQAVTASNMDLTLNQQLLEGLNPSYEHLVASDNLSEQHDNSIGRFNDDSKSQEQQQSEQQESQESQESTQQEDQVLAQQMRTSGQDSKSMELDEIANVLVQKGVRGNVNCIVEKRRNEELVDHAPRNVALPFGLNITTPPRLQHLTGEQIVIICKDDNEEKESEEKQEEPMQPIFVPISSQLMSQIQQVPQVIPLSQVLQHLPQPQVQQMQQQMPFIPPHMQMQMQQQEQPTPFHHQPQQFFYPHPPQPQPQPQPQQRFFYPQQPQQQQIFMPPPPPPPAQQQQPPMMFRPPVPLREVPLNQERIPMNSVMHHNVPINPMAVQDVPINRMQLTHMPMREQPVPVHHLVPPRPQNLDIENFSQDEEQPNFFNRQREGSPFNRERNEDSYAAPPPFQREREMPQPLPLMGRESRLMRVPYAPIADNALPAEFPPRRIRFPDSEPENEGVAQITRIIPIRLEKEESQEEKRPLPIPINAILDMVFRGIRPLVGRQNMPVPIDIKIERIEKPSMENTSQESQESEEDDMEGGNEASAMMESEQQDSREPAQTTKLQQVEIVEKEGDDTHAIPIPADASEAQVFKLENKPEEFLPNGSGRGGVFPIPQVAREDFIFTVSDARAGVMQPEGELKLTPVSMNGEPSARLYPVVEQEPQQQEQQNQQQQADEQMDESRRHLVQPRSV